MHTIYLGNYFGPEYIEILISYTLTDKRLEKILHQIKDIWMPNIGSQNHQSWMWCKFKPEDTTKYLVKLLKSKRLH